MIAIRWIAVVLIVLVGAFAAVAVAILSLLIQPFSKRHDAEGELNGPMCPYCIHATGHGAWLTLGTQTGEHVCARCQTTFNIERTTK